MFVAKPHRIRRQMGAGRVSSDLQYVATAFSNEALDHFLLEGNGVRSGHGVTTPLLEEGDNSTKRRQLP